MPSLDRPAPAPRDPDAALPAAVLEAALSALRARPSGLLADLDGTLARIVADPAAVRLVPGAREALVALAERLEVVGILTGRAALDARRIAGVDRLLVAGNHGLEWLEPGEAEPRPDPRLAAVPDAIERVLAPISDEAGAAVEHKGLSATVHYRNAPDPRAARDRLLAALRTAVVAEQQAPLTLREGRMSIEIRPAAAGDKGTALREVVARHGLRGVVVLGDDVTDLDAFRAAADLRAGGELRAFIGAVRGGDEVPAAVAAEADAVVGSPDEVVALLASLARALR